MCLYLRSTEDMEKSTKAPAPECWEACRYAPSGTIWQSEISTSRHFLFRQKQNKTKKKSLFTATCWISMNFTSEVSECTSTWRVYCERQMFQLLCLSVKLQVSSAPNFIVMMLHTAGERQDQQPQTRLCVNYDAVARFISQKVHTPLLLAKLQHTQNGHTYWQHNEDNLGIKSKETKSLKNNLVRKASWQSYDNKQETNCLLGLDGKRSFAAKSRCRHLENKKYIM